MYIYILGTVHLSGVFPLDGQKHGKGIISTSAFSKSRQDGFVNEEYDLPNQRVRFGDLEFEDSSSVAIEDPEGEFTALDSIMNRFEEKQKRREQEKISEEFAEIKTRMSELLEDYGDLEDTDEFDIRMLTDPDGFGKNSESMVLRAIIDESLVEFTSACQDKEEILSNILESLEMEDVLDNLQLTVIDDIDDISSEFTYAIELMNNRTQRLQRLFHKLLRMSRTQPLSHEQENREQKLHETNLQKKVVGQFKKLHDMKSQRKE